ncbi:MAG: tRNA (guanosine(37)-N1)-methyltransferase TrmD [Bacteriovoracaceae bacterium]|nr:tRNA (guanosine(37)-N1)-methyltransferase TrmD [Bacteriovoracaceae bacterium]
MLTMFDSYFDSFLEYGVLASVFKGERGGDIKFSFHSVSIPQYCKKGFKGVDDSPFGGGVGMIMRADVLKSALLEGVVAAGAYDPQKIKEQLHIVCPAPRGEVWSHEKAKEFATNYLSSKSDKDIVFICGRYEGIDERFLEHYVDQYISLGDYILTGGELAVMTIIDSAMRLSPGVLGNKLSALEESFADSKLEHALYTRPRDFEGSVVPEELSSGDHKRIESFKQESSLKITKKFRPDLLKK